MKKQQTILTTDFEVPDDIQEYLHKIESLESEKDILNKQLRTKEHEFQQSLGELKLENEKIVKTNESLEKLTEALRSTVDPASSQGKDDEIQKLEKTIIDKESKYELINLTIQDLKRLNHNLHLDNQALKFEVEKLKLSEQDFSCLQTEPNTTYGENENLTSEDFLNMQDMYVAEIEDLKKQIQNISDNYLSILAEKEQVNMEQKDKMDSLVTSHREEIDYHLNEINTLKEKIYELELNHEDDDNSVNSDMGNESNKEKYEEMYNTLNDEFEHNQNEWQRERNELLKEYQYNEEGYKSKISQIEEELYQNKIMLNNQEFDKAELEREIQSDSTKEAVYMDELEILQKKIRTLEEQRESSNIREIEKVEHWNNENSELEKKINEQKSANTKLEKKIAELDLNKDKKSTEKTDKLKNDLLVKDREISNLKNRVETLLNDKENLKNEALAIKKYNEKIINDFKDMNHKIVNLTESHKLDCTKYEERILNLKQKFELEKVNLKTKLEDDIVHEKINKQSTPEDSSGISSLTDAFNSEEDNMASKILQLQNDIVYLNHKIAELKNKHLNKNNSEIELLKKEIASLKQSIIESREMYEQQITELQKKTHSTNAEITFIRRNTTAKLSLRGSALSLSKGMGMITDLENQIKRVTAESLFKDEKMEIFKIELEAEKKLRRLDIEFLKEEVVYAEQIAIQAKVTLATLAYEKDSELVKYRNLVKRLKSKL